jgi:hypothetical protein
LNHAAQVNRVGSKKEKDIYLDIDVEGAVGRCVAADEEFGTVDCL